MSSGAVAGEGEVGVTKTLDDYEQQIETWHATEEDGQPLHEYLGLTWEQYSALVEKGQVDL
jgi:hypothetical protein